MDISRPLITVALGLLMSVTFLIFNRYKFF